MPSPFPGMDPYLEESARWPDVHQRLITYAADALQPRVGPNYMARMGERVYIVEPPQSFYPDVMLVNRPAREPSPVAVAEPVTTQTFVEVQEPADAPILITLQATERREPFVELVHAADGEVVTIIEVLSPANKAAGVGRDLYRRKQEQILNSGVNLIEIDLLSTGQHTVAVPEHWFISCNCSA